jgi:hypothetical protein
MLGSSLLAAWSIAARGRSALTHAVSGFTRLIESDCTIGYRLVCHQQKEVRMRSRVILLVMVLAMVAGCVHVQVTPEGEAVRVSRNHLAAQGCTSLGELEEWDGWNGGAGMAAAFENNKRRMQNATGARGGNLLLIYSETGYFGPKSRGEAFRCAAGRKDQ